MDRNDQPAFPGLTVEEVALRAGRGEINTGPESSSRSLAAIVRANVLTLFNAILGTLLVLILLFGELRDALFGIVLVSNMLIGIIQELRAKITLDRLSVLSATRARVRRDGELTGLDPAEVVLDDVLELSRGEQVVADGEVLESRGLEVDESLLTGESEPVEKQPGDRLLLCTDGLTKMLDDDRILEILLSHPDGTACEALVSEALARGGLDNVTVLLVYPDVLP